MLKILLNVFQYIRNTRFLVHLQQKNKLLTQYVIPIDQMHYFIFETCINKREYFETTIRN